MSATFQSQLPFILMIIAGVILAAMVKILMWLVAKKQAPNFYPYSKKESLMTHAEQRYFRQLQRQQGQHHYIFCQVALDRIINTTDQKNFYTYWNKINKKSIDFVLVDKQTLQTVKLIEQNDPTHNTDKRKQRDEFLEKVCEAAGVPLEFV